MSWKYRITRRHGKVVKVTRISGSGGESFIRSRYNYHGRISDESNRSSSSSRSRHSRSSRNRSNKNKTNLKQTVPKTKLNKPKITTTLKSLSGSNVLNNVGSYTPANRSTSPFNWLFNNIKSQTNKVINPHTPKPKTYNKTKLKKKTHHTHKTYTDRNSTYYKLTHSKNLKTERNVKSTLATDTSDSLKDLSNKPVPSKDVTRNKVNISNLKDRVKSFVSKNRFIQNVRNKLTKENLKKYKKKSLDYEKKLTGLGSNVLNKLRSKDPYSKNLQKNKERLKKELKRSKSYGFLGGYSGTASSFYKDTLKVPTIISGFKTLKEEPNKAMQTLYNRKTGGFWKLGRGVKNINKMISSQLKNKSDFGIVTHHIKSQPNIIDTTIKKTVEFPFIKHTGKEWGSAAFNVSLFTTMMSSNYLAKVGDTAIKNQFIKLGAKKLPIETFIPKSTIKGSGLTLKSSKKEILKDLAKTKGLYKEYPKHYVTTSSLPAKFKGSKVLTQSEKIAKGIPIRKYDDPGLWVSPKGQGQSLFLRINKRPYKFSLGFGFESTPRSSPNIMEVLGRRVRSIPKKILGKDKSFDVIGKWQKEIAKSKPSTFIIPKRTEVKLGSKSIKKLIKSVDPHAIGTPESQLVVPQGVSLESAKKLPKSLIGRLKGYSAYTQIGGYNIPVRTTLISESITTKNKGFITNLFKKLKSKTLVKLYKESYNPKNYSYLGSYKDIKLDVSKPSVFALSEFYKKEEPKKYKKSNSEYENYLKNMNSNILKPTKITPLVLSKKNKDTYKITKPKPYIPKPKPYKPELPKVIPPKSYVSHGRHKSHRPTISIPYISKPSPYKPEPPKSYLSKLSSYKSEQPKYSPKELPYRYEPYLIRPNKPYRPIATLFKPSNYTHKTSKLDLYKPYKIQIKSAGKWLNIKTPKKLNYYSAWNKASSIVDTYKERSFRLLPSLGRATKIAKNYSMRKKRFYQPAKTKGLLNAFIEKSKYAINTSAELKGITYKGILAKKRKKQKSDWGIK